MLFCCLRLKNMSKVFQKITLVIRIISSPSAAFNINYISLNVVYYTLKNNLQAIGMRLLVTSYNVIEDIYFYLLVSTLTLLFHYRQNKQCKLNLFDCIGLCGGAGPKVSDFNSTGQRTSPCIYYCDIRNSTIYLLKYILYNRLQLSLFQCNLSKYKYFHFKNLLRVDIYHLQYQWYPFYAVYKLESLCFRH